MSFPSPSLHVLTGPVHSGKTSFLAAHIGSGFGRGIFPCGYLSPAAFEGGVLIGYDLLPLGAGPVSPFLRRAGVEAGQEIGPYRLVPETLGRALEIIRRAGEGQTLIVDEIGPLELEGRGVWPAVEEVLARRRSPILLVIREGLVDPFRLCIPGLATAGVFRVGDTAALEKALGLTARVAGDR